MKRLPSNIVTKIPIRLQHLPSDSPHAQIAVCHRFTGPFQNKQNHIVVKHIEALTERQFIPKYSKTLTFSGFDET